jgi:hypothetical protein
VRPQRRVLLAEPEVRLAHGVGGDVLAALGVLVVGVGDASVGDGML